MLTENYVQGVGTPRVHSFRHITLHRGHRCCLDADMDLLCRPGLWSSGDAAHELGLRSVRLLHQGGVL